MTWKLVKKRSWLVGLISAGLGVIVNAPKIRSIAERNEDAIASIAKVMVLPVGVGIVLFGVIWLISSAFIWRRAQKLKAEKRDNKAAKWKRRKDRMIFMSDALAQSVERCEDLLDRFQSSRTYRVELESELNALWYELENLRIQRPQVKLWGPDENSAEWMLYLTMLKPLMKTGNIGAAREIMA